EQVSARGGRARVRAGGEAEVVGLREDAGAGRGGAHGVQRAVARGVVDDEQLVAGRELLDHARHAVRHGSGAVVGHDADGEARAKRRSSVMWKRTSIALMASNEDSGRSMTSSPMSTRTASTPGCRAANRSTATPVKSEPVVERAPSSAHSSR